MLPSSGYFRNLPCPFFGSGFCERPHCHFKHEKRGVPLGFLPGSLPSAQESCNDPIQPSQESKTDLLQYYSDAIKKLQDELQAGSTLLSSTKNAVSNPPNAVAPIATYIPTPVNKIAPIRSKSDLPELSDSFSPKGESSEEVLLEYKPTPISQLRKLKGTSEKLEYNPVSSKSKLSLNRRKRNHEEYDPTKVIPSVKKIKASGVDSKLASSDYEKNQDIASNSDNEFSVEGNAKQPAVTVSYNPSTINKSLSDDSPTPSDSLSLPVSTVLAKNDKYDVLDKILQDCKRTEELGKVDKRELIEKKGEEVYKKLKESAAIVAKEKNALSTNNSSVVNSTDISLDSSNNVKDNNNATHSGSKLNEKSDIKSSKSKSSKTDKSSSSAKTSSKDSKTSKSGSKSEKKSSKSDHKTSSSSSKSEKSSSKSEKKVSKSDKNASTSKSHKKLGTKTDKASVKPGESNGISKSDAISVTGSDSYKLDKSIAAGDSESMKSKSNMKSDKSGSKSSTSSSKSSSSSSKSDKSNKNKKHSSSSSKSSISTSGSKDASKNSSKARSPSIVENNSDLTSGSHKILSKCSDHENVGNGDKQTDASDATEKSKSHKENRKTDEKGDTGKSKKSSSHKGSSRSKSSHSTSSSKSKSSSSVKKEVIKQSQTNESKNQSEVKSSKPHDSNSSNHDKASKIGVDSGTSDCVNKLNADDKISFSGEIDQSLDVFSGIDMTVSNSLFKHLEDKMELDKLMEEYGSDLDEHDTEEECWRIFNEVQASAQLENPTQNEQVSDDLKQTLGPHKEHKVSVSSEANFGKKRLAHQPDFARASKVTKKEIKSPAEALHMRYQRFQAIYMKNHKDTEKEKPLSPPSFVTPSSSLNKKRVAHVPNAALIAAASQRVSNKCAVIHDTSKTKCSVPEPHTTAITNPKGTKRIAHVPSETTLARPIIPVHPGSKVPHNTRQRYLNIFIDECLKIMPTAESAFQKAQEEENIVFSRSSNKNVYLNLAVNIVRKLRLEGNEPLATNGSSNKYSALAQKQKVSHEYILGGAKAAKVNYSIERKPKTEMAVLTGPILYKLMTEYLLTQEQLEENGYPQANVESPGKAIFKKLEIAKRGNLHNPLEKTCRRCQKWYNVDKNGHYTTNSSCSYHWGKLYKKKVAGSWQSRYSCCDGDHESIACSEADGHVHEEFDPDKVNGFMQTFTKAAPTDDDYGVYALDCEMCYTTQGCELTRITVIGGDLKPVYETFVKPDSKILDYNTRFSGITEDDLTDVTTTIRNVQAVLLSLFSDKTILIGHSLDSDFRALRLIHHTVIDTSVVFPHKNGPPFKRALRNLVAEHLKKIIQNSVDGHDSQEDAASCMELMLWKIKQDMFKRR